MNYSLIWIVIKSIEKSRENIMSKYDSDFKPDFSNREPLQGVNGLFYKRWSPRSFRKEQIDKDILASIFDAARWSPSCYNEQPWLFMTSSGEEDFNLYLDLLVEGNQKWAKNASLIGFILAKKNFTHNDKPNRWSSFDAGAAWMALSLQASLHGLYTHGIGGIKNDEIYDKLNIPKEKYEVLTGFVIGVIDKPENLSTELSEREIPSARKPLSEIWKEGSY